MQKNPENTPSLRVSFFVQLFLPFFFIIIVFIVIRFFSEFLRHSFRCYFYLFCKHEIYQKQEMQASNNELYGKSETLHTIVDNTKT